MAHRRVWLFVAFTCLVVCAALLVPHITVNTDMTKYLPDDYPMKAGLDLVRENMPGMEDQIQKLGSSFGNGEDLMPSELPRTIAIGVVLVFLVLLVMCNSLVEVPLFLVSALFAVTMNVGTNALLPSVSMMTNTISPVLQLVLSMDYSIILMNRYRQERLLGRVPTEAMSVAIGGSMAAILSSAFTTVVSLLMLTFIKLKIGADLGYVLAKGVAFSLLCNFTVLPALIIWADKSVIFKTKRTPRFPAAAVSRFQTRFRWPLALLFFVVVTASVVYQRRTPIYFAPDWNSKASEIVELDNPFLLLYSTSDEEAVPALMRQMQADSNVVMAVSYPTTLGRQCTTSDMYSMMNEFGADGLQEEFLQMIYYAIAHPEGGGRLSFSEIESAAQRLSDAGLMPDGMSYDKMVEQVMRQLTVEGPAAEDEHSMEYESADFPAADSVAIVRDVIAEAPVDTAALAVALDTSATVAVIDSTIVTQPVIQAPEGVPTLTYNDLMIQRTAAQMAVLLGADARQMSMAYRIAGRAGKTMSLAEMYTFARENVLGNKRYEAMIPADMKQKLLDAGDYVEAILAAGDQSLAESRAQAEDVQAVDSLDMDHPSDTMLIADIQAVDTTQAVGAVVTSTGKTDPVVADPVAQEPEYEPTPLDRLIDMMVSGRRYTAAQIHAALSAAGVEVSRDDIDLLFLYTLSGRDFDPEQTITPERLIGFVADTLLVKPSLERLVPDDTRRTVDSVRTIITDNASLLRGENYSFALVTTLYPREGDDTFAFVDNVRAAADSLLPGTHYWIGESEMYKELKDAFPSELLLLSVLTILAIFLIVAFTFRSVLIPVPLVLSVLSGVYMNVIVSGFGGGSIYYLGYLITQGILMGAAIDYSILFTSYFRSARKSMALGEAMQSAFEGSSHSVLTSGLILSIVPMVMSFTMRDPVMSAILKSMSVGSFTAVFIILMLMPAVLAVMDPIVAGRHRKKS